MLIDFVGWRFLFCRLLAMTLTMMTTTGMWHLKCLCGNPLWLICIWWLWLIFHFPMQQFCAWEVALWELETRSCFEESFAEPASKENCKHLFFFHNLVTCYWLYSLVCILIECVFCVGGKNRSSQMRTKFMRLKFLAGSDWKTVFKGLYALRLWIRLTRTLFLMMRMTLSLWTQLLPPQLEPMALKFST